MASPPLPGLRNFLDFLETAFEAKMLKVLECFIGIGLRTLSDDTSFDCNFDRNCNYTDQIDPCSFESSSSSDFIHFLT